MPAVLIREATETDVPAMGRIRAAEWESEEYWTQRLTAYMTGENTPQKAFSPRVVYVAECADEIAGFIAAHRTQRFNCDGELQWINVAAAHRGKGIADMLFARMAEWFLAQQARRICVDVTPENTVARRFYARHGAKEFKPSWMIWEDIGQRPLITRRAQP